MISVTQTLASMEELVKTSTAVPGANVIQDTMGHIVMVTLILVFLFAENLLASLKVKNRKGLDCPWSQTRICIQFYLEENLD